MIDNDFTAKLAAGMRRAKQPGQAEASVPPAAAAPGVKTTQASRPTITASSTRSEGPWRDLHPKRIWPD